MGTPSASQSWSPDALGNFNSVTTNGTTQTRTANQQNEITSISGAGTVTYDANGNLTADGGGNTYVYDAWNRLVAVKNGSTTVAAYGYNGMNERITETHGTATTGLYYSANWQVVEEHVNDQLQARYVWSPSGVDRLVLRDDSSQNNGVLDRRLYVQQDANGNVTALLDTSGNIVERYAYTPFGVVTILNPDFSMRGTSAYNWKYFFQGKRYDGAVGLYDSRERVYSPTLMRFLQIDPTGLGPDTNPYRYAFNSPANAIDPSGLASRGVWIVKGLGLRRKFNQSLNAGDLIRFNEQEVMEVLGFRKYASIFPWDYSYTKEYNQLRKGCIGLNSIRLGCSTFQLPLTLPGTKGFTDLKSALADQQARMKNLKSNQVIVLYAIQHLNENLRRDAVRAGGNEYDLSKFGLSELLDYNFATAAQNANGTIRFWEWLSGGESKESGLIIKHKGELPGGYYPEAATIYLTVPIEKHIYCMPQRSR